LEQTGLTTEASGTTGETEAGDGHYGHFVRKVAAASRIQEEIFVTFVPW